MVKEKELKKIKFNQLLIDTQATFMQEATIKGMNTGLRHSNTMHQPRAGEDLAAGGNEDGQEPASRGSQRKSDPSAKAAEAPAAVGG